MRNALLKFCYVFFFFLSFFLTSNERRGRGVTSGDRDTKSQQTKQLVQIVYLEFGTQEKSQFFKYLIAIFDNE